MQALRIQATVNPDRTLVLGDLPLAPGEAVEVIVLVPTLIKSEAQQYPLRGLPITYLRPTDPVAETEWEVT
ncbi:MAG: hypothetical protein KIT87_17675 [Anaerolineae bacterium]|nr:hypothetical protein [Anaerolineae bacterium]